MPGGEESRDVADLGHEYRGQHRADPGNGLHGVVAEVAGEAGGALFFEHGDLVVDRLDQVPQGLDSHPEGVGQVDLFEEHLAAHPEEVTHGHAHALFRQDGVDLGLEAGAQMDELGSVADEFAQFAQRWWGDPGFGQTS